MSAWWLCRRWPGHGWQIALGPDRCRLWLDHRGVTLDLRARRLTWIRPGCPDLLFHQRRFPERWYGRVIFSKNPSAL